MNVVTFDEKFWTSEIFVVNFEDIVINECCELFGRFCVSFEKSGFFVVTFDFA